MVFSSSTFLLLFLPVSVALYFLMPGRAAKNGWLFAVSLVFYAWGEPVYIWLMLVSVLVNWLFGIALAQARRAANACCPYSTCSSTWRFWAFSSTRASWPATSTPCSAPRWCPTLSCRFPSASMTAAAALPGFFD